MEDTKDKKFTLNGKTVWLVQSKPSDDNFHSCNECVFDYTANDGEPGACPYNAEKGMLECTLGLEVQHFTDVNPNVAQDTHSSELTAPNLLKRASDLMIERAVQYDSPGGERSMEKIVNSFNALTGKDLTEAQGWMFMVLLKLVRDNTRVVGHKDSCDDLIAYAALYGESRLSDSTEKTV